MLLCEPVTLDQYLALRRQQRAKGSFARASLAMSLVTRLCRKRVAPEPAISTTPHPSSSTANIVSYASTTNTDAVRKSEFAG